MKRLSYIVCFVLLAVGAGASDNFTAIVSGLDWQHTNFVNEFQITYSEHSQVTGGSTGFPNIAAGHDIQSDEFWYTWQNWLTNNETSFVNTNIVIEGSANVTMYTYSTWLSAAGMGTNGFRRTKHWDPAVDDWTDLADAMWTTNGANNGGWGVMQNGDIIGPWIFDDLQKGFSALRWTRKSSSSGNTNAHRWEGSGVGGGTNFALGMSVHTNHWATNYTAGWADWPSADNQIFYTYARGHKRSLPTLLYVFESWRVKNDATVSGISTARPHTCVVYFDIETGATFYDIDSEGMSAGLLWYWETLYEDTIASRTSTVYKPSEVSPAEVTFSDPIPEGFTTRELTAHHSYWILQWNFTYQN